MEINIPKPTDEDLIKIFDKLKCEKSLITYRGSISVYWWNDAKRIENYYTHRWKVLSYGKIEIPIRYADCGMYVFEYIAKVAPTLSVQDLRYEKCDDYLVKDIIQ